jgi:hypothetical protein
VDPDPHPGGPKTCGSGGSGSGFGSGSGTLIRVIGEQPPAASGRLHDPVRCGAGGPAAAGRRRGTPERQGGPPHGPGCPAPSHREIRGPPRGGGRGSLGLVCMRPQQKLKIVSGPRVYVTGTIKLATCKRVTGKQMSS